MSDSTDFPRADWDAMTPDEQYEFTRTISRSLDRSDEVIRMFDCPQHGVCIPFAKAEIERLKELEARAESYAALPEADDTAIDWIVRGIVE